MPYKDFREFIETLEAKGQLKRVKKEVDWNLELSHVAKINEARGRGEALLFENVKDYPGKSVAINLVNTREKVALALGLDATSRYLDMAQHWTAVTKKKIPPEWVDSCLWKENTITGDDVDLYDLPTPLFNVKDVTLLCKLGVFWCKVFVLNLHLLGCNTTHRLNLGTGHR